MTDFQHPMLAWIGANNTSQAAVARRANCSAPHLHDILNGKKVPSLALAARLSAVSGGTVPMEAFVAREAAE